MGMRLKVEMRAHATITRGKRTPLARRNIRNKHPPIMRRAIFTNRFASPIKARLIESITTGDPLR
jgi:hypothetical protein